MSVLWTKQEDKILSDTSLGYDSIQSLLPHRTRISIWSRSHKLGFNRDTDVIRRVNSENQRKAQWTDLLKDEEFCSIIDGELLGDGCIYKKKTKAKNRKCYEYSFIAGSIRKDYAEYIHQKIGNKLKSGARIRAVKPSKDKKSGFQSKNTFYSVRFSSVIFHSFYDRWYPYGSIKISVPEDIKLSPMVCLHWYLGDGSLDCRENARMFEINLHTENFNSYSIQFLINKLLDIGFEMKTKVSNKKYTLLRIHGDKARSFLAYIGNSPIQSMKYKWRDWSSHKE